MRKLILTKYNVQNLALLFIVISVIFSNIVTYFAMSFIQEPDHYVAHVLATLASFCASTVMAIISAIIYFKLIEAKLESMENYKIDSLTGLYSRKPFIEDFNELLDTCEQCKNLSVMILDLDLFKKVNDTYGHQAGDVVMTRVGELLRSVVRDGDLVARFGGEEFVIVMCHMSPDDLPRRAEYIRKTLDSKVDYEGQTISFSASIGCYHTSQLNHSLDEILRIADEQLYTAKHNGRNRYEAVYY